MDEFTGELGGGELISKYRHAPDTWNFSIWVAKGWEAAFFETPTPRTRKVAMRSAILMSRCVAGQMSDTQTAPSGFLSSSPSQSGRGAFADGAPGEQGS